MKPDVQVCIACLDTETKLVRFNLDTYVSYNTLIGIDLPSELPGYLCYLCDSYMKKFTEFKDKCHNAFNTYLALNKQFHHHTESLKELKKHKLESPLSYLDHNRTFFLGYEESETEINCPKDKTVDCTTPMSVIVLSNLNDSVEVFNVVKEELNIDKEIDGLIDDDNDNGEDFVDSGNEKSETEDLADQADSASLNNTQTSNIEEYNLDNVKLEENDYDDAFDPENIDVSTDLFGEEISSNDLLSSTAIASKFIDLDVLRKKQQKFVQSLLNIDKKPEASFVAKTLRNLGLPYVSSNDMIIPERKIKPPCAETCRYKCSQKISESQRKEIFKKYWNLPSKSEKNIFISECAKPIKRYYETTKNPSHSYHFTVDGNTHRVCKTFIANTLSICNHQTRRKIDQANSNGSQKNNKNCKSKKSTTSKTGKNKKVGNSKKGKSKTETEDNESNNNVSKVNTEMDVDYPAIKIDTKSANSEKVKAVNDCLMPIGLCDKVEFIDDNREIPSCREFCLYKCTEAISEEFQYAIRQQFWNLSFNDQNEFIARCICKFEHKKPGIRRTRYYFIINNQERQVCSKFFATTLKVSALRIKKIINLMPDENKILDEKTGDCFDIYNRHMYKKLSKIRKKQLIEKNEKILDLLHNIPSLLNQNPDPNDNNTDKKKQTTIGNNKPMGPPCHDKCKFKCYDRLSEETRKNIHEYFSKLHIIQKRIFILSCMKEVEPPRRRYKRREGKRSCKFMYHLVLDKEKHRVCISMFMRTLGICDKQIRTCVRKSKQGDFSDLRGRCTKQKKVPEELKEYARNYVNSIPKINYKGINYIDVMKHASILYEQYKKHCEQNRIGNINEYLFGLILKSNNIQFMTKKASRMIKKNL